MQEVLDEWEDEEVEVYGGLKVEEIRSSCDDHERCAQLKLEPRCDVHANHDDQNLTTGLCAHGITLAITCCNSCALCGRCSGCWWSRCHWCRARFHHADAIPSVEFFPSGFCSPLLYL